MLSLKVNLGVYVLWKPVSKTVFNFLPKVFSRDPQGLSVQYGLTSISSDGLYTISADFVTIHSGYVPSDGYINDVAVIRVN